MTRIPWRLIGAIAGGALLLWAAWWVTHRIQVSYQYELERDNALAELKQERQQNAANIGAIATDIAERERSAGATLALLAALDKRFDDLKIEMPPPAALVQQTEVKGDPCPRRGASPEFVGVWNSAATATGSAEAETH